MRIRAKRQAGSRFFHPGGGALVHGLAAGCARKEIVNQETVFTFSPGLILHLATGCLLAVVGGLVWLRNARSRTGGGIVAGLGVVSFLLCPLSLWRTE